MNICIVEDTSYSNFYPLVYFRPVYHLRCGLRSLEGKLRYHLPASKFFLHTRPYLAEYLRESNPGVPVNAFPDENTWLINGSVLADRDFAKTIKKQKNEVLLTAEGRFIAAFLYRGTVGKLLPALEQGPIDTPIFQGLPTEEIRCRMVKYPWDLVHHNEEEMEREAAQLKNRPGRHVIAPMLHPGSHLVNRKQIWIGKGSAIKPGAVLDAGRGSIVIGKNVTVMSNAVIEGPACIGDSSLIKIGAKIYHSNIGEWCKMGGEVEASIVQSYSNKQHEGFLGHAYLGCWVNIGADTNNSDLKNNYSTVKVPVNGKQIDSGLQFVGLTMGDHSKTGINAMFDTGTVVGVSCNIYGAGLPPKFIPSFTWGSAEELVEYDLEKSMETARRVMARRNVPFTAAYEKLYRTVHDLTTGERPAAENVNA